jgi:pyruvate dehydrogenase E1 component beta subunit
LLAAAVENDNPVIFLEHKKLYYTKGEVPEGYYQIPLGKGNIQREGKDITIVSYSFALQTALQAAAELAKQGIEAEVVDPRTIRPLDTEIILKSVRKTGRLAVVHEAPTFGGFGGEIAAVVAEHAFSSLKSPIIRVCGKDCPVPFGMETVVVPKVEDVVTAVKKLLAE